jgi:hypothetical protein
VFNVTAGPLALYNIEIMMMLNRLVLITPKTRQKRGSVRLTIWQPLVVNIFGGCLSKLALNLLGEIYPIKVLD